MLDGPIAILVADGDPITREFATLDLAAPSAEVTTVDDGAATLAKSRGTRVDAVVLDIDMPAMAGFAASRMIHAEVASAHPPVIMIASREDALGTKTQTRSRQPSPREQPLSSSSR